ncbi:MAG TPA: hypothetical protein VFT62_09840 [Mycobacteriales bacterium]|nr:hypothetical protein [Mycobacteriales bacterium]
MTRRLQAVAAAGLLAVLAACGGGSSPSDHPSASPAPTYTSPPPQLPTQPVALSTKPPPWFPPAVSQPTQSAAYVAAAGLPYAEEMLKVHYHAHLDIDINGKAVAVPPYIGFVVKGNRAIGLAPLHTHKDDGIIHIENNVPADFLLGQFFIEWGVRFTPTCLGPYCTDKTHELAVFVNGKKYAGDPTRLVLKSHQEIAIEYGTTGRLPTPPASYKFPSGY